jgi:general secretion pathway protein K
MLFRVETLAKKLLNYSRQRGAAIIVALFVMTIAAIAAVAMITRMRIDLHRTELLLNSDQTNGYVQGSVAWAIDRLSMDWKKQKSGQIIDKTPIASPVDTMGPYKIQSVIYDAQGSFNLNNLSSDEYVEDFTLLLRSVAPQMSLTDATQVATAVHDWISPIDRSTAFSAYYASLEPAYQAPHRLMTSVSELRLVKGITPALYTALLPFVTALPSVSSVSINNADAPVITSLNKTLTAATAAAIIAARNQSPFPTTQKFMDLDVIKNNPVNANKITVLSNYFLVKTNVTIGPQQALYYTLLSRVTQDSKSAISIVWQTRGTL